MSLEQFWQQLRTAWSAWIIRPTPQLHPIRVPVSVGRPARRRQF